MACRLVDRVAFITGSSSGLGREIAHAYAIEGAHVCCVDLYPGLRNAIDSNTGKADDFHNRANTGVPTHEAIRAHPDGKPHIFIRADVTSASDVEAAIEECVATFGRLDIMVNNAGISVESTHVKVLRCHETEEEDWDKTLNINAKGVFLGCKYAIRQMLKQDPLKQAKGDRGWIVNTASVQGMVGYFGTRRCFIFASRGLIQQIWLTSGFDKNTASYCASKGAVVQLTRQIALDYGPDRIHCNALCPGCMLFDPRKNLYDREPCQLMIEQF